MTIIDRWIEIDKDDGYIKNKSDELFFRKSYKSVFFDSKTYSIEDFDHIILSLKLYNRLMDLKKNE